eukprot:2940206-Pyramimonas_sp.AAC.1
MKYIYQNVLCFGVHQQTTPFLFEVLSGILQGCPASGAIYAICSHPFMAEFRELLNQDDTRERRRRPISAAKACADDVGAVVAEIQQLKQLKQ